MASYELLLMIAFGVLGWALPVAAVIPLLLARGPRWAWAVRGVALYLISVAGVWAATAWLLGRRQDELAQANRSAR